MNTSGASATEELQTEDSPRVVTIGPRPRQVRQRRPRKSEPAQVAKRATAAEVLTANLEHSMDDIAWNASCALEGSDAEAVHQLRVALRRLRTLLSLYRKLISPDRHARLRTLARAVNADLGRARECDVFLNELLPPVLRSFAGNADLAALGEAAKSERNAQWEEARQALRAADYSALMDAAGLLIHELRFLSGEAGETLAAPAIKFARKKLERRHQRLREAARHLKRMTAEERHRLRITVKKQRYSAELFASLFPRAGTASYIKALARVQSALGLMNDVTGLRRELETLRGKAPETAIGLMLGFYAAGAELREQRLRKAWKRFKAADIFWSQV